MSVTFAERSEFQPNVIEYQPATLFARGINPQNQRRCPHCDSIIYSRRNRLCGVCSQELPETCVFNDQQARTIASLMLEEKRRHRAWLHRANFGG